MRKKILIIGAGYVGLPLARLFAAQGHGVTAVKFTPPASPENFAVVNFDIRLKEQWQSAGIFTETPYDCILYLPAPQARTEQAYADIYISAYNYMLENLRKQGQEQTRIIFVSSSAVYAQNEGQLVTEDSPAEGNSSTSRVLVKAEQNALQLSPQISIARFSGLYGPNRLIYQNSLSIWLSKPDNHTWVNLLHQTDAVNALAFLAISEKLRGTITNVSGQPALRTEILEYLLKLNGKDPYFSGTTNQTMAPDTQPAGKRIDCTRLKQAGFQFIYPDIYAGYASILHAYP